METKSDFSCGGLVLNENSDQILVVKVKNLSGQFVWTFPKGHPENQETDQEAALREVKEETGWECRIDKVLMDVSYSFIHNKVQTQKTVRWFVMKPLRQTGRPMEGEIFGCDWVETKIVRDRLTYDSDFKLLEALGV